MRKKKFFKRLLVLLAVCSMMITDVLPFTAIAAAEESEQGAFAGSFNETIIHSAVYSKTLGWKGRVFHWSIDGTPGLCFAKGVQTPPQGTEMIRCAAGDVDIRLRKVLGWYEASGKDVVATLTAQFFTWAVLAGKDPAKVVEEAVVDYYTKEGMEASKEKGVSEALNMITAIYQAAPYDGYIYRFPGYQDIYAYTPGHPVGNPPEEIPEPDAPVPEVLVLQRGVSASYTIEVNKSCAETGKGLGDAIFQVMENGVPIGRITTDSNGFGSFSVEKSNGFEAYYCPNFAELTPEQQAGLSGMADGNPVFHSEAEASAYLDGKVQDFKNVSYRYTVVEETARYGYVRHGSYPGDEPIMEKTVSGDGKATFLVVDHRTEGKLIVEKEDLETGKIPQGEASLQGAVYGLYAAAPILHPDGHTGIVYGTNDLTATATTDATGRLVFETYTEGSFTGKPLLLGDYYVKEISRSEGYELSVSGRNQPHTNFGAEEIGFTTSGGVVQPSVAYRADADTANRELYFHVDKTGVAEGYEAELTNVPEGSSLYAVTGHEEQREEKVLTGFQYVQQTDEDGSPLYVTALGGECKLNADGNPIPTVDEMGNPTFECYEAGEQIPLVEAKAQYETVISTVTVEDRTPVSVSFAQGTLRFESDSTGDGREKFVLVLPDGARAEECKEILRIRANTRKIATDNDGAGTYIRTITLAYPGQNQIMQDGGTTDAPLIVQERVIKESLKIYKYISEDYENNSWGVHVTNKLPGFFFKVYMRKDLETTGKLVYGDDGAYDYERFFKEYPELADQLAVMCDMEENDKDGDMTTVHASGNANESFWYAVTRPLPYGRYVIVEQQPVDMPTKQYRPAKPQEISLPFIPEEGADNKQTPSSKYFLNGAYEKALVPWSVVAPGILTVNGISMIQEENFNLFVGYAYKEFENQFYSSRLRIEKTDSETGENLLHDGAYFKLYKAKREEATGNALMQYGTLVYSEADRVVQYDDTGAEKGIFKAFSTIRDVAGEDGIIKENVGFLETYQPLGAGTYALVEVSAPAGYVRSKPVAIEIYSDKVEYYTETASGKRRAVMEEYAVPVDNKREDMAVIEVKNQPIEAAIHKVEADAPENYIKNAELTLYQALPVTVGEDGLLENILYKEENGTIVRATLTATGEHMEICKTGEVKIGNRWVNEYDAAAVPNAPVDILVTDEGVASVLSTDGTMYVYPVNHEGEKLVYESWCTTGEPEEAHYISRIPAGAYILEETGVPYEDGYTKAEPQVILIQEMDGVQEFYMEDDYTVAELSKLDFTTGEPVEGAELTLYRAEKSSVGYEKGEAILVWNTTLPTLEEEAGEYEIKTGNGNLKYWITETSQLHLEYIPVGIYILEETLAPDGYGISEDVVVEILDVGGRTEIQKAVMYNKQITIEVPPETPPKPKPPKPETPEPPTPQVPPEKPPKPPAEHIETPLLTGDFSLIVFWHVAAVGTGFLLAIVLTVIFARKGVAFFREKE